MGGWGGGGGLKWVRTTYIEKLKRGGRGGEANTRNIWEICIRALLASI